MANKEYRELYYKDMSEEGLKKLEKYGFTRHFDEEEREVYWTFPADSKYGDLWLYESYWTDPELDNMPSEHILCNGEFDLGDRTSMDDLTVEAIEVICKLYKDGLVEFRNTKGTSYEIQKGLADGE